MTRFRSFSLALALTFSIPWLILIVMPHAKMRALGPVPYDNDDPSKGEFPPAVPNIAKQGAKVYAREGCVQCHTQVIRPDYLGVDSWKKGWGDRQENNQTSPDFTRSTVPRDYLTEEYAMLGVQRNGPDLSNAGYRFGSAKEIHEHLYDPRADDWWSAMPSYRHLYELRKIRGQRSDHALDVMGRHAPAEGYEIVPTDEASALVGYIMSLRKDAELPNAETGDTADSTEAGAMSGT